MFNSARSSDGISTSYSSSNAITNSNKSNESASRSSLKDASKVNESLLKSSGAAGVIIKGNGIQVIYGPRVTVIKSNLEDFIASGAKVDVDEDLVVENKKENKEEDENDE